MISESTINTITVDSVDCMSTSKMLLCDRLAQLRLFDIISLFESFSFNCETVPVFGILHWRKIRF